MALTLKNILSRGPFSAVRPHYEGPEESVSVGEEEETSSPTDSFEPGETSSETTTPPVDELQRGASRSGVQAACRAFPQVVQLLVEPSLDWGENLSREVGLPVVSLAEGSVDTLREQLNDPKYSNGFILEGIPADAGAAAQLDDLLGNVPEQGRRVLSWDLTSDTHQEVLDHYMDRDLLWMVPESSNPADVQEARSNVLSCLHGLPAVE